MERPDWKPSALVPPVDDRLTFTQKRCDYRKKKAKGKPSWRVTPFTNNNLHTPPPDEAVSLEGKQTDRK